MPWYRGGFRRYGGYGYGGGGYKRPYYGRPFYKTYKKKARKPHQYAARRKAIMSQFMKSLNQSFPAKGQHPDYTDAPITISGMGDYSLNQGASIGSRIGAFLGDKAQGFLGRITGLGDYNVSRNSLVTGLDPPPMVNSAGRGTTIRHREYLGDIISAPVIGGFNVETYNLNPGDGNTFPWLSTLATNFQEYRFDGVVFEFKTMSADALNSTNTALGQVIMATNYNASLPSFQTKYEMENTEFANSCKPSCSMMHPIECARKESVLNELYVAPGGEIPNNDNPQFYHFGKFQIATNGFQAANINIGELWVTYEITFFKPVLLGLGGAPLIGYAEYVLIPPPPFTFNPTAAPFGSSTTGPLLKTNGDWDLEFTPVGGPYTGFRILNFPRTGGKFMCVMTWQDTASTEVITRTPDQSWTGCSAINSIISNTAGTIGAPNAQLVANTSVQTVVMCAATMFVGQDAIPAVTLSNGRYPRDIVSGFGPLVSVVITEINDEAGR